MYLKIGKILICKEGFKCGFTKGFTIEIGDKAIIERFDMDDLPNYLYIRKINTTGYTLSTWLQYDVNMTINNNNIKYIWNYFETKQTRAKRIIDGFKSR